MTDLSNVCPPHGSGTRPAQSAPDTRPIATTTGFARSGDHLIVRHHISGGLEHGGGIGRLVGYICAAQSQKGNAQHLVTDTRGPRVQLGSLLRFGGAIADILKDRASNRRVLQHLHFAGRGSTVRKTVLGLCAAGLGAPYCLHLHDYDYAQDLARRPDWQKRLIRRLFRCAEHVIVLGQRDQDTVHRDLGVPSDRVSIRRNCVPDPGPRPPEAATKAPDRPVHVLFLGQLGPRKGVPELLAALSDPLLPSGGWRATLAGDGPVEQYRAEAKRLGIDGYVDMPGWVGADEAAALRRDADILVLPSHAEGFAMAVLEGLASGLAVVTTRVGAHDEMLEDEVSCLFVRPGDARGIAVSLARLIADAALRDRLGRGGRALFCKEFQIDGYVGRFERLLCEVTTSVPKTEAVT